METVAVIDFETTGLAPEWGARATEVAAVLVRDGRIVDRYESLMNTGAYIPPFIEALTGISNEMVRRAPAASKVMRELAQFVGEHPLAAHNASFDCKFWDAELARVQETRRQAFVCTMRVARRVYPDAPNHKLGTLVRYARLPVTGRYHRALADAEMAANLLLEIEQALIRQYRLPGITHEMLQAIQSATRRGLGPCMEKFRRIAEGDAASQARQR